LLLDEDFEVVALVGRRPESQGINRFQGRIENLCRGGIAEVLPFWNSIDGVFDATSAESHTQHWPVIRGHGKWAIDLTPSRIGVPFVPVLEGRNSAFVFQSDQAANYSMVTCGGQSSAPVIFGLSAHASGIREVEVSSSIASLSAGPATRNNLDEYIDSTESMISLITGCRTVKSILVLNPAEPPVMMRTTVTIRAQNIDLDATRATCDQLVAEVRRYVPGYDLVVSPHRSSDDQVSATVRVEGAGYFLPKYAGNLDIINAAAVETARRHHSHLLAKR
jgi:acetaldehyde dehydrogenase